MTYIFRCYKPMNFQTMATTRTVIALIGSTAFKPAFMAKARELTWQGYLVWTPTIWSNYTGEYITAEQEAFLDSRYKDQIARSDEVFVINDIKNGEYYIGKSTCSEIEFAQARDMPIKYLNNPATRPPRSQRNTINGSIKWPNTEYIADERIDPSIGCTS